MRRVALYLRVSTDEQAKGHPLDSQRDTLREWARAEGWNAVCDYDDPGASGTSVERRLGFLRMIQDAEAGRFDTVLVLKLDRFARNRGDSAIYRKRLERAGVELLSYNERTDGLSRSAALLTNGLQELLAEHYSVELSEKTAAGWRKRAEKGLPAGDIPFGYVSGGPSKAPVVVVEEAEALRGAFERYSLGDASLMDIAEYLNERGFAPRSKRGSPQFGQKTVRGMLANRFYIGDIVYKGDVVAAGLHEPVVSRELFQRVQDVREKRRSAPQSNHTAPTSRAYLLQGIAICAGCGGPMWANSMANGRHYYYRCSSRVRGHRCSVTSTSVRADAVESYVRMMFEQWQQPTDWAQRIRERSSYEGQRKTTHLAQVTQRKTTDRATQDAQDGDKRRKSSDRVTYRDNEARLQRYRQALLDGLIDYDTAAGEIRRLESELLSLQEPPQRVDEALLASEQLTDIRELWPLMRPDEQQRFIRLVLDCVVIDSDTGEVTGVAPNGDFAAIFDIAAEDEGGSLGVVTWRPRAGSKRRSDRVLCGRFTAHSARLNPGGPGAGGPIIELPERRTGPLRALSAWPKLSRLTERYARRAAA